MSKSTKMGLAIAKSKVPECAKWVLTQQRVGPIVATQRTEWPFPVSIKPDGAVQISLPATQVKQPLPDEPALF